MFYSQPLCGRRSPWSKNVPWKFPLDPLFGTDGSGSFPLTQPSGPAAPAWLPTRRGEGGPPRQLC